MLLALDVGLATLGGVEIHAAKLALVLVLLTTGGVLLPRLAANGDIASRSKHAFL